MIASARSRWSSRQDVPRGLVAVAYLLGFAHLTPITSCANPAPHPAEPSPTIRVNVYVSPTPSPTEAAAVLTLGTILARRYPRQDLAVEVHATDRANPSAGTDTEPMAVDVRGGVPPDLLSAWPEARDDDVARGAAAQGRDEVRGPDARIGRFRLIEQADSRLELQGAAMTARRIKLAQADLGGPVTGVVLHLVGTHSGLPPNATAELSLLWNGGLVHSQQLRQTGRIDVSTRLPGALLGRDNTLTLRVRHTGPGAFTVHLEPDSHVTVTRGQTLPPGFDRFPQALLPSFQVSFDRLTPDGLQAAVQLVAALQRLTRTPLRPVVVEWSAALASGQPLVALALDPQSASVLEPPLAPGAFRVLDSARSEIVRLGGDARFAVMQAFAVRRRDVLLVTHWRWPEGMLPLVNDPATGGGWYELSGDLRISPRDRLPFSLRVAGSGLIVEPIPAPRWPRWEAARDPMFAGITLAVGAFLLWARPRLVRAEPHG